MVLALLWIAAGTLDAPRADEANPASGDIIVTGERVRRTLKDTASSVQVFTRVEIEARPIDRVEQVLAAIPNIQLGDGIQGPAIRGLDTTGALQALPAFLGGNRPRTTVVVDGRAETYNEFIFGLEPVWDVNRIEVFRSPQTTTQGQNSIAGAIFVYTMDPTFEPEFRARAIYGNFRARQISAVATGPVSGDVAVRLAGDFRYSRTTSRIADRVEDADPDHDVYGVLRAKVLVKPRSLPGTKLVLTYSHQESQAPQIVGVTPPYQRRRDESGFYGTFRIRADSLTASAQHQSGDITANLVLTAGDSLARRLAFPGLGQSRIDGRDWSGEAVFNWAPDGPLRITWGVSQRHTALRQRIDLSLLAGLPHFRDWQDGTGLFGEVTWRIAPKARLTVGLRNQRDRQKRIGAFETAAGPVDLDYDRTFDAWLPKISFAYDLSEHLTAGALVQKAYNPGGTTLRFDIGQPDNFEAESLWDYEAFVRGSTADGRLNCTANLFFYNMHNAQRAKEIGILAPAGFLVGFADLFNVPKARSYGAEVEAQWRPSASFSASAGIGLLQTKIVRSGVDYPEFEGKEFDRAPHLTASAAVEWKPIQRLSLSAQVRHHGPYFSDPVNDRATRIESGTIADARAEYRFDRFSVFGYARNVFDTLSITSTDGFLATLEDPREIGVGLETRF